MDLTPTFRVTLLEPRVLDTLFTARTFFPRHGFHCRRATLILFSSLEFLFVN